MTDRIHEHFITLSDGDLVLRPMTESDWDFLLRWNNDPELLWFMEGDHVTSRELADVQSIYRMVSLSAFVFVAEHEGRPIGDCWLQRMNMARILARHPSGADLRRIDLAIGEKEMWGQGLGTRMIRLLTRFGFEACGADKIYGLAGDHNPRSCRAFEKSGYTVEEEVPAAPGEKGTSELDYVLTREVFVGEASPVARRRPREGTWAVLLDAGGVILDETEHELVQQRFLLEAVRELVPDYGADDLRRDIQEAVEVYVPRVYRSILFKRVGRDQEACEKLWSRHVERWKAGRPPLKLVPGIGSVIRELAGGSALALAGQYGCEVSDLLREHDLLDHFTCGLHQGYFEVTKPDPRFFEQIAHILGVQNERCVVVGDRIDKDVVPARQLGMKAILIRTGLHRNQLPRLPEEVPDVELPDVTGLPDAVRTLARRAI